MGVKNCFGGMRVNRAPMTLSVLSERRVYPPPGLKGGMPAERGRNTLVRANGKKINLGPKAAVPVHTGVRNISDIICCFCQNGEQEQY